MSWLTVVFFSVFSHFEDGALLCCSQCLEIVYFEMMTFLSTETVADTALEVKSLCGVHFLTLFYKPFKTAFEIRFLDHFWERCIRDDVWHFATLFLHSTLHGILKFQYD